MSGGWPVPTPPAAPPPLQNVSEPVLRARCPLLLGLSHVCHADFVASLSAADQLHVRAALRQLADSLQGGASADLLHRWTMNRAVGEPAFYTLLVLYTLLIGVGAGGSGLVVLAVTRQPAMQTARNTFIVNLAVSDLLLCVVTMPLTLMEILTRYWPLGADTLLLCKLFGGLQGVSVFVSAMSITAIALDRYQAIVYPTRGGPALLHVGAIIGGLWALAALLASPLFIVRQLDHHPLNNSMAGLPSAFDYCVEAWTLRRGRAYYSIFSMMCQYVVPTVIVSVAHVRITRKLRNRLSARSAGGGGGGGREAREARSRRTSTLLTAIALIYAVSWIPLNVCNLVSDFVVIQGGAALERMRILYAVCHMIGMSSACSNPVLYGWLNDNFRKQFVEIAHSLVPCARRRGERPARRSEGPPTGSSRSNVHKADNGRVDTDTVREQTQL